MQSMKKLSASYLQFQLLFNNNALGIFLTRFFLSATAILIELSILYFIKDGLAGVGPDGTIRMYLDLHGGLQHYLSAHMREFISIAFYIIFISLVSRSLIKTFTPDLSYSRLLPPKTLIWIYNSVPANIHKFINYLSTRQPHDTSLLPHLGHFSI